MSDEKVKILADQAWCADAAIPIRTRCPEVRDSRPRSTIGNTQTAGTSMAVFRAAFSVQPRPSRRAGSHPPATLPIVAIW